MIFDAVIFDTIVIPNNISKFTAWKGGEQERPSKEATSPCLFYNGIQ